jgi:uncharacterized SAM-binding protein YcdF (DUF218 family)
MMALGLLGVTPRRRRLTACGIALLGVIAVLAISLARFMHLMNEPEQLPQHTDGIVALTGGPERVETALRLLAAGRADRLLLSGIGGGAELPELARLADVDPRPLAARVTIDRHATTTRGNALETAAWARQNDIHSLLVVTASYHMPRAITELSRALPEATLYPIDVVAYGRESTAARFRFMAQEYVKFLASVVGVTTILPNRELPSAHGSHAG